MAFGLHVADHGLDGGAASQFSFDGAEDAALLARDEDAARVRRVVAAVPLVSIPDCKTRSPDKVRIAADFVAEVGDMNVEAASSIR